MAEFHLIDIVIVFALSIPIIYLCSFLKIPSIVGFLLTGIAAGPSGLVVFKSAEAVQPVAEIGVVLLLFAIGLEFSFNKLFEVRRSLLIGGSLQVLFSTILIFIFAKIWGLTTVQSLFSGFIVSLSSTAVVLKLFQQSSDLESPHGRTALSFLIYQDLAVIPMMLLIPVLAKLGGAEILAPQFSLQKMALAAVVLIVAGKWVIPKGLYAISLLKSRELFLISVIMICLSVAWITSYAGLSLALGAFVAGLMISESEYAHNALSNIMPFRDLFASFFFISIGMLVDVKFLSSNIALVLLVTFTIMLLKTLAAAGATLALKYPLRIALLSGFAICQIGEFSFVLARNGLDYKLIDQNFYNIFLAVSVLSIMATPFVIKYSGAIADRFVLFFGRKEKGASFFKEKKSKQLHKDHLLIIGYGVNGRHLVKAAKQHGISYVVIEMNPITVRNERKNGEPIYYGDAVHPNILHHAGIERAKMAVIAVSDPIATRRITAAVRQANPKIFIITRVNYFENIEKLYHLGADEVIAEDVETSVEIFSRVLSKWDVAKDKIEHFTRQIRSDTYNMARTTPSKRTRVTDYAVNFFESRITHVELSADSKFIGKTIMEAYFRRSFGVTLVALKREGETIVSPDPFFILQASDVLVLLGDPDKIEKVKNNRNR